MGKGNLDCLLDPQLIDRKVFHVSRKSMHPNKKYVGVWADFTIKTLEIEHVSVNSKPLKLDDGSVVDLKAISDHDFSFTAAILHFGSQYCSVLLSDLIQSATGFC